MVLIVSEPIMVYVTTKDEQSARDLARVVVGEGVAACANIVPRMQSVYRWEGKIVEDTEALMFLKTDMSRLERLTTVIREHHSYSVPCITAFTIVGGNPQYIEWIKEEVSETTAG